VVEVEAAAVSDAALAYRLRTGTPAVMGRLRDGKLVLDVRTVFAEQEDALVEALRRTVADGEKAGEAENAGDGEGDE
jgi:L-seryl-tRNA(Ser) seleniumtransferase